MVIVQIAERTEELERLSTELQEAEDEVKEGAIDPSRILGHRMLKKLKGVPLFGSPLPIPLPKVNTEHPAKTIHKTVNTQHPKSPLLGDCQDSAKTVCLSPI